MHRWLTIVWLAATLVAGAVPGLVSSARAGTDAAAGVTGARTETSGSDTRRRYRETRPQEPLKRGRVQAPAWVVWTLGAVLALAATATLAHQVWRSRRR